MADLCTLDDLKQHPSFRKLRQATVDVADEEFLQIAISATSRRFERYTGRWFSKDTYVQYFSPCGEQSTLQLRAVPVTSVTIVESATSDWSAAAMDATRYGLDVDTGVLSLRYSSFIDGFSTVRATVVGGYDPIPDDLKYACMMQVAHEFERATNTSTTSQQTSSGGQVSYAPMDFLPVVQTILAGYQIPSY